MSDTIRELRKRAYNSMLVRPLYKPGKGDKNPIQLLPNAESPEPYTGEKPKVEGVPPVPGQGGKQYKPGELA